MKLFSAFVAPIAILTTAMAAPTAAPEDLATLDKPPCCSWYSHHTHSCWHWKKGCDRCDD